MDIKNNKQLIISVMVMAIGIVMILGTSYSLIRKSYYGTKTYSLSVGNIKVSFDNNNENNITLTNAYPISDSEALSDSNEFSFNVVNNGSYTANYSINIEETSDVKISEVIRFSYNLNDHGYTTVSTLSNNNIVSQNMVLEKGKSDHYKMKFWISETASASYMDKTFSAKLVLHTTQNEYKYATNVIALLGDRKQDGAVYYQDIDEYRYVGQNVDNYVWFNCEDGYTKGINHCEKWRIISSVNNTWENGINNYKMLKIVRSAPLDEEISFSNDTYEGNSYLNSYLNYYANNTYYNALNMSAKNMILKAKWHIGKTNHNSNIKTSYDNEIKEITYADIGTISPSDYGLISNNIDDNLSNIEIQNNWLYNSDESLLTINMIDDNQINIIDNTLNGKITNGSKNQKYKFLPVVYLKPDVSIIGGYGTNESPYEVDIKFKMNYGTVEQVK